MRKAKKKKYNMDYRKRYYHIWGIVVECMECGALVTDAKKHSTWHERVQVM